MQKNIPQITLLECSNRKNRSNIFLQLGVFILFCIILILTYLPAVQTDYYFMEDYIFVRGNAVQTYNESFTDEIVERTRDGKSIYGAFLYLIASLNVSGNVIRLLGIISLGLLAYIIYNFLKTWGIKSEHSFLISILVCILPGFQIYIAWTVCVPYLYSAILSFASGALFFNVVMHKNRRRFIQATTFFIIIFLLVIAMYIYPPTAMFYWAVGIIPLSLLKDEDFTGKWHKPFILHILTGLVSTALYFFSVKILHFFLSIGFPGRGGLLQLTKIPLKLEWFFCCPLTNALNLWNIFPTYKIASIVGIIIIGMFLLKISNIQKKGKKVHILWNHCQRLFLVMSIVFLSYLPNLVITDTVSPHRTLASLTIIIFFLFYFGLVSIFHSINFKLGFLSSLKENAVTITLIILTLIATYHAHTNVNDFAMLQANDYKYVKNAISKYGISNLSSISEIYVRRIDENKIREKGFLYDEFGISTTSHPWGPRNVVRRALHELGIIDDITTTQGAFDQPVPIGDNILVIDMTRFDYLTNYNRSITKPQRYCLTFPKRL